MKRLIAILVLAVCSVSTARAAESQPFTLNYGDLNRTYHVYRPERLGKETPVPLVIMLHGGFGSGAQAESSYGWDKQADTSGFVVAYPDGVNRAWNAGGTCCGTPQKENIDDIGFLTELIRAISQAENIDQTHIYLTGMSNGAAMSYRYACEGPFPIAAIGSVSGTLSFQCSNPHALSVMEIHGLDDENIPFDGGQGSKGVSRVDWLPVRESVDSFRKAAHCALPSLQTKGPIHEETSLCENGRAVVLIAIEGAGHQWPGSEERRGVVRRLFLDPPSKALDATSLLWVFFRDHPAH